MTATAATAATAATNGSPSDVRAYEDKLVLDALNELRLRGDGELRVAARRNPETGQSELVFVGVTQKADLEKLRKMYSEISRTQPITFGGRR